MTGGKFNQDYGIGEIKVDLNDSKSFLAKDAKVDSKAANDRSSPKGYQKKYWAS
jgi:hypothetical protein